MFFSQFCYRIHALLGNIGNAFFFRWRPLKRLKLDRFSKEHVNGSVNIAFIVFLGFVPKVVAESMYNQRDFYGCIWGVFYDLSNTVLSWKQLVRVFEFTSFAFGVYAYDCTLVDVI